MGLEVAAVTFTPDDGAPTEATVRQPLSVTLSVGQGLPGTKGDPGSSAYDLALTSGFVGTLEEWLASLAGAPGDDGTNAAQLSLRVDGGQVQWQRVGDAGWVNLIAVADLKGADGTDGANGLSVELQKTATAIQWRQAGGTWADLVALADLRGAAGDDGAPGDLLTIGTVTTGAAGSSAEATITGASPDKVLNLTIPRGDTGATGSGGGATRHDQALSVTAAGGVVDLAASARLVKLVTSAAVRFRLYRSSAQRTADAARAVGTDPTAGADAVLLDVNLTAAGTYWLNPVVDVATTGTTYYWAASATADLTLTWEG